LLRQCEADLEGDDDDYAGTVAELPLPLSVRRISVAAHAAAAAAAVARNEHSRERRKLDKAARQAEFTRVEDARVLEKYGVDRRIEVPPASDDDEGGGGSRAPAAGLGRRAAGRGRTRPGREQRGDASIGAGAAALAAGLAAIAADRDEALAARRDAAQREEGLLPGLFARLDARFEQQQQQRRRAAAAGAGAGGGAAAAPAQPRPRSRRRRREDNDDDSGQIQQRCPWASEDAPAAAAALTIALRDGANVADLRAGIELSVAAKRAMGKPPSPLKAAAAWIFRTASSFVETARAFAPRKEPKRGWVTSSSAKAAAAGPGTSVGVEGGAGPSASTAPASAPAPLVDQPSPLTRKRLQGDLRVLKLDIAKKKREIVIAENEGRSAAARELAADLEVLVVQRDNAEESLGTKAPPDGYAAALASVSRRQEVFQERMEQQQQQRQQQQQQQQEQQQQQQQPIAGPAAGAESVAGLVTVARSDSIAHAWRALAVTSNGHMCLREREHRFESAADVLRGEGVKGPALREANVWAHRSKKERQVWSEWKLLGDYVDGLTDALNAARKDRGEDELDSLAVAQRLDDWRKEDGDALGAPVSVLRVRVVKPGLAPLFRRLPLKQGAPAGEPPPLGKDYAKRAQQVEEVRAARLDKALKILKGELAWN